MIPKISIITICKNERPFIQSTCDSVISQSYTHFEWIVVDGASTDGTLDILKKYTHAMRHFISEPDAGIYPAMNKGISLASGEFCLFLNGGDFLYSPFVLHQTVPHLTSQTDVLYTNSYRLHTPSESSKDFIKTYPETLTKDFFLTNTLGHQSSFIRRTLFDRYGLYREDFKIVSEKEKWLVFMENNVRFQYLPLTTSVFRLNGISRHKTPALQMEKQRMLAEHFGRTLTS